MADRQGSATDQAEKAGIDELRVRNRRIRLSRASRFGRVPTELQAVAAVFPSRYWGVEAQNLTFANGRLSGLERDFPFERMIEIEENRFNLDGSPPALLAIALADPEDRKSWHTAKRELARVKEEESLWTMLFVPHAFPRYEYPFEPCTVLYRPRRDALESADLLVHFATLDLRKEFPRIVYALTHYQEHLPCVDFMDVRAALGHGNRGVYIKDTAQGPDRAQRAAKLICAQLRRKSPAVRYTGGVAFLEANTWSLEEMWEIQTIIKSLVPNESWILVCTADHYDVDPWLTLHVILTFED